MRIFKWVLNILGLLSLILIGLAAGGIYWVSQVESLKITEADLKVGGPYTTNERQALLNSCQNSADAWNFSKSACQCIADKAGTQMSRLGRIGTVGMIFERDARKFVALIKGSVFSNIPREKIDGAWDSSKKNFNSVMKSCGVEQGQNRSTSAQRNVPQAKKPRLDSADKARISKRSNLASQPQMPNGGKRSQKQPNSKNPEVTFWYAIKDSNDRRKLKSYLKSYPTGQFVTQAKAAINDRAVADFTRAIKLNPSSAKAYSSRGLAYRRRGEFDLAIADYSSAIQLNPNLAKVYNNRGVAYEKKGQFDQAIADYNKALELRPGTPVVLKNLRRLGAAVPGP